MCDCFHLAFPNWHGPGTGAGRRLRGPEREAEDDSVCEEPAEFVEGERPRPQGSSPVEEFPAAEYIEKPGEDNFYDPLHKTGSGKKGKKVGFGSLFDKRSSGKMSQMENGESEVLVKTAKEACAEGLVVTGGGKDGIFIKELKPDSPASKHLRVKEGDQILSATVYFDNVSYEDAIQILEHAQAYKMEFCLRRKPPEPTVQEDVEAARLEGEEGSPKMRGRKKKRQEARISWPKFPSFSKGRKGFKRSHSTSEAEEQRKLEMSPTTSDTESPVKSPLKSPDGKEKKKKRLKLKVKMKGLRSKSVEHPTRDDEEPTMENLGGVENQVEQDGTDIQSPEEMQLLGEPQVVEQEDAKSQKSTKARDEYTFPSLTGPEMETGLHRVELITLDKALKTTDISDALAESSPKEISSESVKTERSELRVNIQGKDLMDTVKESQIEPARSSPVSLKDQSTSIRTSDSSTHDNVVISPSVMSHTDFSDHQSDININTQTTTQERTEKNMGHGEMDMSMPKVDVSLDMSDIGLLRKSPRIGGEKQWKDKTINIPEPESYGIRTRGPLADMATSKSTFDALNGLQFTSDRASASSALKPDSDLKFKAVISQPKSSTLDVCTDKGENNTVDIKVPRASEIPMEISIDRVLADVSTTEGKIKAEFKLPKVDISESNLSDTIKMTKVDNKGLQLPNREELEIPGMEDATSAAALQIQGMKLPQINESNDPKLTDEIPAKRTEIEFNLEDVKALVAKIPTFKLPRIDMSGIYTHKEITPDSDKILATAETSPPELSEAKTDVSLKLPDDTVEAVMTPIIQMKHQDTTIKLPKVELPPFDDHEPITVTGIEDSKPKARSIITELKSMTVEGKSAEIKYKLPKREDIEIPGMEAIMKTSVQMPDVKSGLEIQEIQKSDTSPSHSTDRKIQIPFASAADIDIKGTTLISDGKTETLPADKKNRDKKTKKIKKSKASFGIAKPDIRFPDTGIDLPQQTTTPPKMDESQVKVDTKMFSAGDEVKTKTHQAVSLDIQKPEIGIKGLSIKEEIKTSKVKEEGQISIPEVDIPTADIKIHGIGISPPKVKGTETAVMDTPKTDITTSPPEAKVLTPSAECQVTIPEVGDVTQSTDVKSAVRENDVPESETKDMDIKLKKRKISFPKFSFSRTEVKAPEVGITSPKVDASFPETSLDTKDTEIDATAPESETKLKDKNITGSPTKFKLPTLKFPNFAMSPQKVLPESTVSTESAIKTYEDEILEVKLPEHKLPVSGKLPTVDLHTIPSADIAVPYRDTVSQIEGPKLPSTEIKGPELNLSITQPEVEIPSMITQGKDALKTEKIEGLSVEGKTEPPEMEIKVQDGKSFKLPKFGISVPKMKGPDMDINVPKADADISPLEGKADIEQSDVNIPSVKAAIDMPKVDVELPSVDLKGVSADTDTNVEVEAKVSDTKLKKRRISFPKFSFSRSESKGSDVDVEPLKVDITTASVDAKVSETDIKTLEGEAAPKDKSISSSPTKFKLPTLKFHKFGMSPPKLQTEGMDADVVNTIPEEEILEVIVQEHDLSVSGNVPTKELHLSSSGNVNISPADVEAKIDLPDIKMESHELDPKNTEGNSVFKMPKFGISLPKVKGPEISMSVSKPDGGVSVSRGKSEIQSPDVEIKTQSLEAETDIGNLESKETDIKFKMPKMSFPKFGHAKSEINATETDVAPKLDISLSDGEVKIKDDSILQGSLEITSPKAEQKIGVKETDLDIKVPDVELKDSATLSSSPSKFKLPTFKMPKIGVGVTKQKADIADPIADIKSPEVKLSGVEDDITMPVPSEVTAPSIDLSLSAKTPGILMEKPDIKVSLPKITNEVEGSQISSNLNLPSISLTASKTNIDITGTEMTSGVSGEATISTSGKLPSYDPPRPRPDVDISVPDPEITSPTIDTELPQAEAKLKKRRISFPKFGFSKPDIKSPDVDVTLAKVDVSLPEGEVMEPKVDVNVPEDIELKDGTGMGSPTKFKLPTFKLPKIGVSASKGVVEVPEVDIDVKTPQASLPETELNVSGKVPAFDGEGSGVELEVHSIDVAVETKVPEAEGNMALTLTKLEGPEVHVSAPKSDLDVSLPEGKVDVDVTLPQGKVEMPGVDSKGLDLKMKRPSFSFPKFGFSKAEVKAPDVDIPEGKVEVTQPDLDVKVPEGEAQLKDINVTSPTKFKLPTIKFPKIGVSAPKGIAEIPTIDIDVNAPEVSLTHAELTILGDMPEVDVEGHGMDTDIDTDMRVSDIEGQESKLKLPKFGISLPSVKGPEVDVHFSKTDLDISLSRGTTDIETSLDEAKGDVPDLNLKDTDIKAKKPGFSFPKFGFSKPEVKGTELDVSLRKAEVKDPEIHGKIPEGSIEVKDSKSIDVKMKRPSFSFPKFGLSKPDVKAPDIDVNVPEVDMSLPEGKVEIKEPEIDAKILEEDVQSPNIHISPSKYKLPTFKLPKIGVSAPKGPVQTPELEIDVKAPEVSLPDAELKVSGDVPEVDLKVQKLSTDTEGPEVDGQGNKFKLPNFGISLPKVKAPEFDMSVSKPDLDVSLPEGKVDVDAPLPDVKAEIPGVDSKAIDVKVKRPSFSFPKFGWSKPDVKATDIEVNVPEVDMSLPEGKVEIKEPEIDAEIPEEDVQSANIHISPSKYKLPTFKLPKIGVSAPKGPVQTPELEIDVKAPEVSLPDAELKVSGDVPEVDLKGQKVSTDTEGPDVDGQGNKFKLPNFGISLPKVKAPEFDMSVSKPDLDVSLPEGKVDVDAPLPEVKAEIPGVDSKAIDIKVKRPSFSFPKFGWSKPDVKTPNIDVNLPEVDTSLPEGKVDIKGPEIDAQKPEGGAQYIDTNIQTSPTKFKLPTLKFPKTGVATPKGLAEAPGLDIDVKGPEISLPDAELNISGKIPEVDIKGQHVDTQLPSIDVSASTEGHEFDVKMKRPSFSFPKFGFSKSDVKVPEIDANLPEVDMSPPEGKMEIKGPEIDAKIPEGDLQHKDTNIHASPTKFKLPTFKLPKIGVSASKGSVEAPRIDIDVKAPEVSLPDAELKVSGDVPEVDLKNENIDAQAPSIDVHGQAEGPEVPESKLKLPKFGISLPKVKGPEIDLSVSKPDMDVSLPEGKADAEASLSEGKIELSVVDSKGTDIKMKRSGFSFPKFGLSKPDIKATEVDTNLPEVDISLPEGNVEVKETELNVKDTEGDIQLKDTSTITSPTKFKLPTFKFPKIGVSAPKGEMDVDLKAPEVSETEAELKVSMEVPTADVKGQPVDIQAEGHDIEGQGGKFKLPKFGITLPKVKGPEIDVSVSKSDLDPFIPEGKMYVEAPSAEVKAEIPEVDSKGLDVKSKRPSFSFPKFGLSKPIVKAPDVDVTLPEADVSLPEGAIEVKDSGAGVQVSEGDIELKDANISESPSKFKLPTIKFPKFGVTAPKVTAEIEHLDASIKGTDINVPDSEGKGGPLSVAITGPSVAIKTTTADVDMKTRGVDVERQESKLKLPKFGMGLPRVKGPEANETKADADITLPEGAIEVKVASTEVDSSSAKVKVDLPAVDSKGIDVTVKKSSFSFPRFGFSKSDRTSEVDTSLPKADISLSEGNVEVKEAKQSEEEKKPDSELEDEVKAATVSGSPSKFKLPTIKFPRFGVTVPKVESHDTDVQVRGKDIPDNELQVSGEPVSIDIKVTSTQGHNADVDVQTVGVGTDGQGSTFKLPKFGVSLPKVKGSEVPKPEGEISLPEGKVDMERDVEDSSVETRVDVPKVDVTARKPGFSFPKFTFSKPEVKSSVIDGKTPQDDVSKPEGIAEIQDVTLDVKSPDGETAVSSPTKFKLPTFKLPTFGGATLKGAGEVTVDPSLPQGTAEVKSVDADINTPASEVTIDLTSSDVNVEAKEVKTRMSFPKFGFSKTAVKAPEVDVTLPSADVTLPEGSVEPEVNVKIQETEPKGEAVVGGSPSKFKLPTIKLPKFGTTTQRPNIEANVTVPEIDSSSVMISTETDVPAVEGTVAPDSEVSTQSGDSKVLSSPSKFKLPTFKMPKLSLSKAKSEEDSATPTEVKPQEDPLEGDKENTQVTDKSPKFTLPTIQDVLRGFDVEFHVPTLDETDEPKGASQPDEGELKPAACVVEQDVEASTEASKDSDSVAKTNGTVKEIVKEEQILELQTEQKLQDTKDPDPSSEKGSWFKFPKFPSPTKSVKLTEKETIKPSEEQEQNTESDNLENEISITSSVRSSDAFADESSAPTTEQIAPSLFSPTKVTVKYAESISTGTGDVTAKIITSTARTELISMEPDLPEKVNISSSDSSSMDTLKQESGAIHIITSNVQAIPDTQKATILSHTVQSLPVEQVIIKTTSTPWSMNETSTLQEDSIVVEKHVIKEMSGENTETVIITQKTCMLEADSGEPISHTAASSSQTLRDIVHKEKMNFFESREMPLPAESIVVSSVTTETRVIKHSTEEHSGK
ncbi:neuroblast differentiation-associated protein AHNAK-like isoform X2 [Alosa sapidissima]|uniref:neuroblast differentiation-associated protein AHNAK-like isoform X2 n=1 Tax=Alosa sapidissima TaxID=34773 RepID=UPI001C081D6E|nr:neuroblast differentiation-associated protein AHNAK-like isoform X2 [Alosa sapidissima]